jgi:hypothetical protein
MLWPASVQVLWSDTAPTLEPNETKLVPIMIIAPVGITAANRGSVEAVLKISDGSGHSRQIDLRLLGPG